MGGGVGEYDGRRVGPVLGPSVVGGWLGDLLGSKVGETLGTLVGERDGEWLGGA